MPKVHMLFLAAGVLLAGVSPGTGASSSGPQGASDSLSAPNDSLGMPAEAVLYYFHRTTRCQTCLTIEAYIDETLRTHFARDLQTGRLVWRPTNIEEPESAHFEEDFALESNSAILVRLAKEEESQWVNLEAVWDLLEDKDAFIEYIRSAVSAALSQTDRVPGVPGVAPPCTPTKDSQSGPEHDSPH